MLSKLFLRLLGLLLLGATGMKAIAYSPASIPTPAWIINPWITLAILQCEIFLGVWLLSGYSRLAAWFLASIAFGVFAVVNFRSGWIGQASCGCFGAIAVSPWTAFGLDVGVVLLLGTLGRPAGLTQPAAVRDAARHALAFAAGVGFILATWTFIAIWALGSTDATLAFLRGRRVFAYPSVVDFGAASFGDMREASVTIQNMTGRTVLLVGGTLDCSCSFLADLPTTIPPGEKCSIRIRMRTPDKPGNFSRVGWIWTDAPGNQSIPVTLTGRSVGT